MLFYFNLASYKSSQRFMHIFANLRTLNVVDTQCCYESQRTSDGNPR